MKRIRDIFFRLLLLSGVVVLLAACGGSKSAKEVAQGFISGLYSGKGSELVSYFSLPANAKNDGTLQLVEGKLDMAAAAASEKVSQRGGVKDIKVLDEKVNDDGAFVVLEINFNDGSAASEGVALVKIDGAWKIKLQ